MTGNPPLTRNECLAKAKWCRELAKQPGTAYAAMLTMIAETWEQMAIDVKLVERYLDN